MLYVVASPIGNLGDISRRALEVLQEVSLIACEDTRHTKKLLTHYDIHTPCVSCHAHNEKSAFSYKIEPVLTQGKSVALLCDSGTPLISDPGAYIVEEAYKKGVQVSPIPGASAVTAILSISGLHGKGFWFEGFLGRKPSHRKNRLISLMERNEAFIILESPYRLVKLLGEITDINSTREVLFAREITKKFETIQRNSAESLFMYYNKEDIKIKGECIVLVYPIKK